jgi:hypothetical protein
MKKPGNLKKPGHFRFIALNAQSYSGENNMRIFAF